MTENKPPLALVMAALDCSKPAASLVVNGKYDRKDTDLNKRWAAICQLINEHGGRDMDAICIECPREDCTGCRIADIHVL